MPGTTGQTMPPIRLLIDDDHPLPRQGLRQLCEGMGGFTLVAEAGMAPRRRLGPRDRAGRDPMDIVMPDVDGVEAIRHHGGDPLRRIIALTMYREEIHARRHPGGRCDFCSRPERGADRGHRGRDQAIPYHPSSPAVC